MIACAPAARKASGLEPDGDVQLTEGIRRDPHLKLEIASDQRRTTIGEIVGEPIEEHL